MTDDPSVDPAEDDDDEKRTPFYRGFGGLVVVAIALALLMKTFLIQAFFIPSGSMEQTLHGCPGCRGDRVLVNKVVYKFRDIHRGEIVVFNGKNTNFNSETSVPPPKNMVDRVLREVQGIVGFGAPGEKDFIKRVIGIEGDTVACCDQGRVTVNGVPLDEPYLFENDKSPFPPVTVPKDHVFVMGDHRSRSSDSRVNGTVPTKKIIGRAFVVVWPPSRMKGLRVPGELEHADIPERSALAAPPWSAAATPPALGLLGALPVTYVRRRLRR
jgi:signal peptidase I